MANHSFLPSDDQNPDFLGAHNPDNRLTARFFVHPVKNDFKSEEQGRPIFDDVTMVRIDCPGDQLNVVVAPVRADHKRRFPLQWAHFNNQMEGDQRLAGKTPINMWPRLTPAQCEELRYLKFLSVEDVANASDGALQTIGMVGGMSPFAFREHAQRFLALASSDAVATKQADALAAANKETAELRQTMLAMQEQLNRLAGTSAANPGAGLDKLADALPMETAEPVPTQKRTR
jgi:hypothetical protein